MTQLVTRRYFFLGCFALAACRRPQHSARRTEVSIHRVNSYEEDLAASIRNILLHHRVAIRDRNVVLKPNFVEFDNSRPVNTHARFVSGAAAAFRSLGAQSVRIAEGPGHRRATFDLADAAGYFREIPHFENSFTDLNLDEVTPVSLVEPFSKLRELYLPQTALRCDLLVTLPKMKTHHWAGATLSMKNLFGVVPGGVYGWPKNPLHWAGIDESIADLHNVFPRQFCLVDGITCMEGNGPILGGAKHMGLIIAGGYPPAVDTTCCRLMGIDPAKVRYLSLTSERSGWREEHIRQTGEPLAACSSQFALPPGLSGLRERAPA